MQTAISRYPFTTSIVSGQAQRYRFRVDKRKSTEGEPCEIFEKRYFPDPSADLVDRARKQVHVHREMLNRIVRALGDLGMTTREEATAHKALKLVEEPLWKISEAFGKYETRYFTGLRPGRC